MGWFGLVVDVWFVEDGRDVECECIVVVQSKMMLAVDTHERPFSPSLYTTIPP